MTAAGIGTDAKGPLVGLRVVELAGIGPAPYGAMLLADLGADVIRIDRPGGHAGNPVPPEHDFLNRGRRSIMLDLKSPGDLSTALTLVRDADVFIEAYRPGVAERLGLGPAECLATNPRLVYARMTGWGQDGPLADCAGHDITYIARSGALYAIGDQAPTVPLNLIGDFGGGGMLLALGVLAAVRHAEQSGSGQVVDAAILDGTVSLLTMLHTWRAVGLWQDERASNMLDGGAHFYRVYETADGRHVAVGAIEPQFYERLRVGLGIPADDERWRAGHSDRALWPSLSERVGGIIKGYTLEHWVRVFDGIDACVAPVLTPEEATEDKHNVARSVFLDVDGVSQPAPVPRFDRTPPGPPSPQPIPGEHTELLRSALATAEVWRNDRPSTRKNRN